MRILLIEDDYTVAREIDDRLKAQYAGLELLDVGTEAGFDESFPRFESEPPDLVILDIMLGTTAPAPAVAGYRGLRGGLRCLHRLSASARLSQVPVILHTALEWAELEPELKDKPTHVVYARKTATLDPLFVQVRSLLMALDRLPPRREPVMFNRLSTVAASSRSSQNWDVFISYASEDRVSVAAPIATALQARGLAVWFDEFELRVGDSLTRTIDAGLARSRYGIVILSHQFFAREWPQRELDALLSRESDGLKVVLPVWHGLTASDVGSRSAILASRYAARTDQGLDAVVQRLLQSIDRHAPTGDLTGMWAGRTGRMRLEQKADRVSGDYDWKVAEWAGHVEGVIKSGVFRYKWNWERGDERGCGYFVCDFERGALHGEWFYGDDVDLDAAIDAGPSQGKHAWSFIRLPADSKNVE